MKLKDRLLKIMQNCFPTSYMENMLYAIECAEKGDKNYEISGNCVIHKLNYNLSGISNLLIWHLEHCIGEMVLQKEDEEISYDCSMCKHYNNGRCIQNCVPKAENIDFTKPDWRSKFEFNICT